MLSLPSSTAVNTPYASAQKSSTTALPSCFSPFCAVVQNPFPRFSDRYTKPVVNDVSLGKSPEPHPFEDAVTPPPFQPVWATGLLSGGFLAGLAGVQSLKGLFKRLPRNASATVQAPMLKTAKKFAPVADKLQYTTHFNYGNPTEGLPSMLQLAATHADYHKPLLAYLGAGVLGYLTATLAQGVQESIIREQETRIRGHLVNRLKQAFGESIQRKQAMDDRLRDTARNTIVQLLQDAKIPLTPELSILLHQKGGVNIASSSLNSQNQDRQFLFGPVDRRAEVPLFGMLSHATQDPLVIPPTNVPINITRWLAGGVLVAGVGVGALTHTLFKVLLKSAPLPEATTVSKQIGVYAYNTEAAFLSKNKTLLAGMFLVSAVAKTGKLLVDALREIEVTRQNAETEYRYQSHNWTQIDPDFHWIAESAALKQELSQFTADLPLLRLHPEQLAPRIQALLNNRGRSSPPAYYLSTPAVMLTEAKG